MIIELSGGSAIFALADEEGNGPGVMIQKHGKQEYYLFAEK